MHPLHRQVCWLMSGLCFVVTTCLRLFVTNDAARLGASDASRLEASDAVLLVVTED